MNNQQNKLVLFQSKKIRRIWHNEEWFYSVVNIVEALTDSANPRDYWFKMKIREEKDAEIQLSTICLQLKLESADGKRDD
jgi:DNA-damage-inducible protein D